MDFIVSEFINLIKGCSNRLALEKEVWRRGIELQCQTFARALEASWSVAAAFDRQGKAIGCEPPARDERVCPPGGEPSRVYGYRSFCPLGGRDGFACGETPTSSTSKQR